MRRSRSIAGSAIFFAVAPGVVAGVIPYTLTGWEAEPAPVVLRSIGVLLIAAGVPVLVHSFARFVAEGAGTPAPIAPPERLVVGGLYRYVRNPMYVAIDAVVIGQAVLLDRPVLYAYAAIVAVTMAAFVRLYEEPVLARRYGADYERYRRAVPGWIPRSRRRTGHVNDLQESK
jgi:protein-S-isoprenylcysteine O-methyltransferase Ste14